MTKACKIYHELMHPRIPRCDPFPTHCICVTHSVPAAFVWPIPYPLHLCDPFCTRCICVTHSIPTAFVWPILYPLHLCDPFCTHCICVTHSVPTAFVWPILYPLHLCDQFCTHCICVTHSVPTAFINDECSGYRFGHTWLTEDAINVSLKDHALEKDTFSCKHISWNYSSIFHFLFNPLLLACLKYIIHVWRHKGNFI